MTSRRSHQCHWKGCDSQAEWQMFARFGVMSAGGTLAPLTCKSSVAVCDRHRAPAEQAFFAERNLDALNEGLTKQGLTTPRPENISVTFVPIEREKTVLELGVLPAAPTMRCDRLEEDDNGVFVPCTRPAIWQVALLLWDYGQKKDRCDPTEVLTDLCICDSHRMRLAAKDVLSAENKAAILRDATNRNLPMPDFRSAEMSCVPIDNGKRADTGIFYARGIKGVA